MPRFAKGFIIGVSAFFVLLLIYSFILYVPLTTNIDKTGSGYELSIIDPEYAQPCEVSIVGKYKHYLIKPDFMETCDSFEGEIILPSPYAERLEQYTALAAAFTHSPPLLSYQNFSTGNHYLAGDIYVRKNFDDFIIAMRELKQNGIGEYSGKVIVAPAATVEEAWDIYNEYLASSKREHEFLKYFTAQFP